MSALPASGSLSAGGARGVLLPVRDPATRLFLLTRLIVSFDESDQQTLAALVACGFTPELIDKLRSMSMADAMRFASSCCGLSVGVDGAAVRQQMNSLERARTDRQMYEGFIRAGASPTLVSRLFGVSSDDVRRLRKLIAPGAATGGRPRIPDEVVRGEIESVWRDLEKQGHGEREALWRLHQQFQDLSMATLETVIRPPRPLVDVGPAWPLTSRGLGNQATA
ncbi:hypothetical protein RA210_U10380 [Rubrivivax sp. A210]|uniref:STY4526/YPO1902 family pathogenicity island replication protein n=1 Tax=Rubrivivax sp. A210 TaxID=2772301 RepID=UPI00191A29F5|nr:STY4526/YPO1902 family pathogenicity island replication protein [Rubrivivax sp. A210]CAD5366548.1 hypothetical protein RA210_U10380 [Rubrivivax sp. A210]